MGGYRKMLYNDFPEGIRPIWLACDTETHTYIKGHLVTEEQLLLLGKKHPLSWFRENATVHTYAYSFSDGRHLAICETWQEFLDFCTTTTNIKSVWFYNSKFDFANIDYQMLTDGWISQDRGRLTHKRFNSLHSDFGARYSLKLCHNYRDAGRHEKTHVWTMYDFMNIFGGGLKALLEKFNVTDFDGNTIRKSTMDYQTEKLTENDIDYIRNDTAGLYHLIRIADDFLKTEIGYTITGAKPEIITAGGLGKRVLLDTLYGTGDYKNDIRLFQRQHCVDITVDRFYRTHNLYRGAITFLNPRYCNRVQIKPMYRYDVNSMYPHKMATMPDIVGYTRTLSYDEYKATYDPENYVYILDIKSMRGKTKPNMLPLFYDPLYREYRDIMDFNTNSKSDTIMFFDFEFKEFSEWYDFDADIVRVLRFEGRKNTKYADFVNRFYKMKSDAKREKNPIKESFAKLLLNSTYGKLAENPCKVQTHREIDEETKAVRLVTDETITDETSILSVIQGAIITAMGRVSLMQAIREICPNPDRDFVYCDTDSVHSITPAPNTDPYTLGAFKDESTPPFTFWKYLAPKTYIDGREINGKMQYDIHTKGVPTRVVYKAITDENEDFISKREIDDLFSTKSKFQCLAGINIIGGKALIPTMKQLCREENIKMFNSDDKEEIIIL